MWPLGVSSNILEGGLETRLPLAADDRTKPSSTMVNDGRPSTTIGSVEQVHSIPRPEDPAEALAAVVSLRRLADRLEFASVQCAIDQGWSWAQVAQALGVTRQAVHKRHARRLRPRMDHKGSA